MIGRIRGTVASIHGGRAVIMAEDCGLGYVVILPLNATIDEHTEAAFWIWHAISQDDQKLYGFDTSDERWLAELIATTHRVGPGIAHKAVTSLGYEAITALIKRGDEAGLAKAVKGLGAKTASSIIANLKGKLGEIVASQDHRIRMVHNGLKAIGIEMSCAQVDLIIALCKQHPDMEAADLIKNVLSQHRT